MLNLSHAGGNPGAMNFIMALLADKSEESANTQKALFNAKSIRGTNLYILHSDICGKDMKKVHHLVKNCPESILEDACNRQDGSGRELVEEYMPKSGAADDGYKTEPVRQRRFESGGKVETVRQRFERMLFERGMFEKQATAVMDLAIPVLNEVTAKINRWEKEILEVTNTFHPLWQYKPLTKSGLHELLSIAGWFNISYSGKDKGFYADGKKQIVKPANGYQIKWDSPACDYPDAFYMASYLHIKPVAYKWLDDNLPAAWNKAVFAENSHV